MKLSQLCNISKELLDKTMEKSYTGKQFINLYIGD